MAPHLIVVSADLFRYRLPLRRPLPLAGGTLRERSGWLLRLMDAGGRVGWGEAAPLPGFSAETLEAAGAALGRIAPGLLDGAGLDAADVDASAPPSVRFAVGAALGALTAVAGSHRPVVALNALLLGEPDTVVETARARHGAGYRVAKLKVGRRGVAEEAALVRRLHAELPDLRLRLDANRAWSWDEALAFAERLHDLPLDYLEEPLHDPARLADLAAATGVPVALDESILALTPDDAGALAWAEAVVLKPTLLGWNETRRWVSAAHAHGLRAALSSAFESGVGILSLLSLAAAGDGTPAGLDTYDWLDEDVLGPRLRLGPEVDVWAVRDGSDVRTERLQPCGRWTR